MTSPLVAVGPLTEDGGVPTWVAAPIEAAGGVPVPAGTDASASARALVWVSAGAADQLRRALEVAPGVTWVQLPFAGIERVVEAGLLDPGRTWTCAKGSYAEPVAEHALGLAVAGLRRLPERLAATSWGRPGGTSLYDQEVTILGGGGITEELLRLLAPYRARVTVVRRRPDPVHGAARVLPSTALADALPGALVVFLALALTPATRGIIDAAALELMDERAWLVNVARGGHVVTDALVDALRRGAIAGAALDVTDPEPLPDGHPLWDRSNCIITPHTADTWEMVLPHLASRIEANVAHFVAGEALEGLVDPTAGY